MVGRLQPVRLGHAGSTSRRSVLRSLMPPSSRSGTRHSSEAASWTPSGRGPGAGPGAKCSEPARTTQHAPWVSRSVRSLQSGRTCSGASCRASASGPTATRSRRRRPIEWHSGADPAWKDCAAVVDQEVPPGEPRPGTVPVRSPSRRAGAVRMVGPGSPRTCDRDRRGGPACASTSDRHEPVPGPPSSPTCVATSSSIRYGFAGRRRQFLGLPS
jgi:hypothetical protein